MASVNKVILVGNLGRDPEVRYGADGGSAMQRSGKAGGSCGHVGSLSSAKTLPDESEEPAPSCSVSVMTMAALSPISGAAKLPRSLRELMEQQGSLRDSR